MRRRREGVKKYLEVGRIDKEGMELRKRIGARGTDGEEEYEQRGKTNGEEIT